MSLSEYAHRSLALRADLRASNGLLAFLFETVRGAAGMALVLAVTDLVGLAPFAAQPRARLLFILGTAVFMTLIELVRVRAIGAQPRA